MRLMELIVSRDNLMRAFRQVVANKGAPGIDKMTVAQLGDHLKGSWPRIKEDLLSGQFTSERRAMRNGRVSQAVHGRLDELIVNVEAWLAWALWRQAHRRLGLDPRAVTLRVISLSGTADEMIQRWRFCSQAFRSM